MTALKARGFKVGRISYKASNYVAKGKVIKGSLAGLQPAGVKIGLVVSKGRPTARRASGRSRTPAAARSAPHTTAAATAASARWRRRTPPRSHGS